MTHTPMWFPLALIPICLLIVTLVAPVATEPQPPSAAAQPVVQVTAPAPITTPVPVVPTPQAVAPTPTIPTAAQFADYMEAQWRTRKGMVTAIALLLQLPPSCTVDNKLPDTREIARFIMKHGFLYSDSLKADVQA